MTQEEIEKLKKRFASRLIYYRTKRGFTQEELAELTGISVQTLRNYESARTVPSSEFILKASKILKFSLDAFVSTKEIEKVLFPDSEKISEEAKKKSEEVIALKYMELF